MHVTAVAALVSLYAVASVSAHGHLSYPTCRGCNKYYTSRDSINSPLLTPNLCRGESAGVVTTVGHALTLRIDASAPHKGPCSVYLLDENLGNPIHIADKQDCAAPGVDHTWAINIPSEITGRKVLRWIWEGCHVQPCEKYEQCSDINITGGNGGNTGNKPLLSVKTPVGTISTSSLLQTASADEYPSKKPVTSTNSKPVNTQPVAEYNDEDEDAQYNAPAPSAAQSNHIPNDVRYNSNVQPSAPAPGTPKANPRSVYAISKCGGSQYTCNGSKFGICNTNTGQYTWIACPDNTECQQNSNNYYCKPTVSAY